VVYQGPDGLGRPPACFVHDPERLIETVEAADHFLVLLGIDGELLLNHTQQFRLLFGCPADALHSLQYFRQLLKCLDPRAVHFRLAGKIRADGPHHLEHLQVSGLKSLTLALSPGFSLEYAGKPTFPNRRET
jgi:hypothetical protein